MIPPSPLLYKSTLVFNLPIKFMIVRGTLFTLICYQVIIGIIFLLSDKILEASEITSKAEALSSRSWELEIIGIRNLTHKLIYL